MENNEPTVEEAWQRLKSWCNGRYKMSELQDSFARAVEHLGRKLLFYNESFSGGYIAYYADNNGQEKYNS